MFAQVRITLRMSVLLTLTENLAANRLCPSTSTRTLAASTKIAATISQKKRWEFCTFLLTADPPREFDTVVIPPPTLPWSMLFSREQKCFGHTSTLLFLGGGGSILNEPGFGGKYSKIRHTLCIFLNIFVHDCIFEFLKNMPHSKYLKWNVSVVFRKWNQYKIF